MSKLQSLMMTACTPYTMSCPYRRSVFDDILPFRETDTHPRIGTRKPPSHYLQVLSPFGRFSMIAVRGVIVLILASSEFNEFA